MEGEEQGSQLVFGFFVYRVKPTYEQNEGKGEITGMVLVKKSGERRFFTYIQIDPETYTPDKFMEYFKDTMMNNEYDDNPTRVFEIDSLDTLIDKLILQEVNGTVVIPVSDRNSDERYSGEEEVVDDENDED